MSMTIVPIKILFFSSGVIRYDCGDNSYIVEDSVGDLEKIWREDILADGDDDTDSPLRVSHSKMLLKNFYFD